MTPLLTKRIKSGATLKMLERAGLVKCPPENCRPKGKKWGAGFSYVDAESGNITHKGRKFTIQYADGCFFPFVWEQFGGEK
jgi:hypothetical protein